MSGDDSRPVAGLDRRPARAPALSVALAVGVSLTAAAFAVVYRRTALAILERAAGTHDVVRIAERHRIVAWIAVALTVALAIVATDWAHRRWPGRSGLEAMAAAARGEQRHISVRATTARSSAIWLSVVGMAPIGREAAIVEIGGTIGSRTARRFGGHGATTAATGMAAAFAAAYVAPLSAVSYLHEHLGVLRSRRARVFCPAGALIGWTLTHVLLHEHHLLPGVHGSWRSLAGAGLLAVVPSIAIGTGVRTIRPLTARASHNWITKVLAVVVAATVVSALPLTAGNGNDALRRIATGAGMTVGVLVVLVLCKAAGCLIAVGSGAAGGLITPTLTIGAASSAALTTALHAHDVASSLPVWTVAVLGAAFTLAVVLDIPWTAGLLVAELTGTATVAVAALAFIAVWVVANRAVRSVPRRTGHPSVRDEDA